MKESGTTDGQSKVTRNNTLLLVITRGVAGKLENLGSKVLKDRSEVNYFDLRESDCVG